MPEMTRGLLGAKASDDDESGPWPLLVSANEPTYLAGCNRRPKVYVMSNDSVSPDSGAGVADDTRRRNDPVPVAEPVDVVCRDGGLVRLRPLDSSDGEAVVHFYSGLDQQSLYRRFMSHHLPNDAILVHPLASPDPRDQVLGAEISGELIAIGLAVQNGQDQAAEVAFAVATDHQGRGIGTLLLEHLAAHARDCGRTLFKANTLTGNLAMLGVFEQAGFRITEQVLRGEVDIVLTLDDRADVAVDERESWANAASIRHMLRPATIAVVGASRTPGSVGHALMKNLLSTGFEGAIYPVNPSAASVLGVPAYPSVDELPVVPDLAVIAVPSHAVRSVLVQCGKTGVGGVVIVTAGFAESDAVDAERELVELARSYGMRMIGPNCIGIVNTADGVNVNATFSPAAPMKGGIGFASQSGALGIAALDAFRDLDLGISTFVSLGNKADVSGNDLLQYWQNDPETAVAALYLESFGNPRKFARIARNFCRTKPLIAVKSGRTASGRRAASSHTAALASNDLIADALFRDAGIIRVATLAELFDVSRLLATQPLPGGQRVGIVGNSGGPGILAADACEAVGLTVAPLSDETRAQLAPLLLPGAGLDNPVDLIAAATPEHYELAVELMLADDDIDVLLVIYTDPMVSDAGDIAAAIRRATATSPKPVAANFLAADIGSTIGDGTDGHPPIPVYEFPEAAAAALGHACGLGEWRRRATNDTPAVYADVDTEASNTIVAAAASPDGTQWMAPDDVAALFREWGIDLLPSVVATTSAQAGQLASEIGLPVAIKVVSDTITHKTDVGGVVLDIETTQDVVAAFDEMKGRLGAEMTGVVVQPMAGEGVEVIVGGLADASFGPVVMVGAGGTTAEVWEDRAVALAPLSIDRAHMLIGETKVSRLLNGYRGTEAADTDALADLLCRVGALLAAHPEIVELDLNPVVANAAGVQALDARCRITPVQAPRPHPRRHLD